MTGTEKRESGAASIHDVARAASVSAQTVSRVTRGHKNVSEPTRMRVLKAISELGYTPNRTAQALRTGSYGVIGLLTQEIRRTGEAHTANGVIDRAAQLGYSVTLVQVEHPHTPQVHKAVSLLSQEDIDGLVIVQAGDANANQLSLPPNLPVASSDSNLVHVHPSASADQVGGVRKAVNHLLDLGHRTVYHVRGPHHSRSAQVREAVWRDVLTKENRQIPPIILGDWSAKSGYEASKKIAQNPDVTAVFCANDEVALGLIRALHERNRRVPEDVSVIGFDGIELAEFSFPPLSTVKQDFHGAGVGMVNLIHRQIQGETENLHITIPTQLILRGSTAAPAAR
ncbi:LacI family DNA-binding transcriptional regulator [uncultured Actinomyces sp.]|uniref:LacI family DNA-binding transcriptional regulator n=1 Tax=uncultured Actinomyces sp. TaxID=249061 RepID=UPI0026180468|nr:LacI family DNA-binding transcriptional regulator [uncultured Actinomyces sp.]